ncbi:glycosyl hydrolase family 8 [Marinospirillum alkaliphilum]|uniref:cellulase n=1 Tax=Marinospirillum alkaliphilum DSM 21637 TaxID=1122209 RepID=A0A1K1VYU3_9GAMM|nr:glycosyl hydrolase family 8 [Marinospirillum alkaliphilum]SFX29820.1 endoglucanase [Marinospirillum alkaliphilum DSM 21637]
MKLVFAAALLGASVAGYWLLQSQQPAVQVSQRLSPELWQAFAEDYEEAGRIIDRDNQGISHSEGQGYGLLFAEAAGDRQAFDRIWRWTQLTLQRPDGLFAWKFEPCATMDRRCISDRNNATDAEILIAWALLKAHQRWQDPVYLQEASRIARATSDFMVIRHHDHLLLLPGATGFTENGRVTVNASYWVFPALEALGKKFPDQPWQQLASSGQRLVQVQGAGPYQLPPDWADHTALGFQPSRLFPARYSYDAVRVPLHLAWSNLPLSERDFAPYLTFWSSHDPVPAWVSLIDAEQAEYAWSTGMQAVAKFVTARVEQRVLSAADLPQPNEQDGYFSWSLLLLTHLAINEVFATQSNLTLQDQKP